MSNARFRVESITAEPLSVPLIEPFVIATGRVDVTPSVLVTAVLRDLETGAETVGLGEAATLPPVTKETQKDVLFSVLGAGLRRATFAEDGFESLTQLLDQAFPQAPVARAGVETALLDAWARLRSKPLRELLGGETGLRTRYLTTDITIPIQTPEHMAELAASWWSKGFRHFKVKVGRGVDDDLAALEAIYLRTPEALFRLDANAGYSTAEAVATARAALDLGLRIECYEQPCGRLALDAMAEVGLTLGIPVVADESVTSLETLARVIDANAVQGVNLKLVKSGGPLKALAIGRAARAAGLSLMVGAMVETRLGIAAAAQVAAALGGVEYPDLDTALLLSDDPFTGGYTLDGPHFTLGDAPGLGVERR